MRADVRGEGMRFMREGCGPGEVAEGGAEGRRRGGNGKWRNIIMCGGIYSYV